MLRSLLLVIANPSPPRFTSPRLSLPQQLRLSTDQIKYLCEEASRAQTQGQRAEIFACEVARASAGEFQMHIILSICSQTTLLSASPKAAIEVPPAYGCASSLVHCVFC